MRYLLAVLMLLAPLAAFAGQGGLDIDVLIRAIDNEVPAGADSAMCWQRGDFVAYKIHPGVAWGNAEDPARGGFGRFWLVTVMGVPDNELTGEVLALVDVAIENPDSEDAQVVALRTLKFYPENLQAGDEADLLDDGLLSITWNKFRNAVLPRGNQ